MSTSADRHKKPDRMFDNYSAFTTRKKKKRLIYEAVCNILIENTKRNIRK